MPYDDDLLVATFCTVDTPYEEAAEECAASAREAGYESAIVRRIDRGSWERNTAMKPGVVLELFERFPGRPILLLDADARVKKRMPLFSRYRYRAELMLRPCWPAAMKGTMEAVRYKGFALQKGSMWQTGILFVAPTNRVRWLVAEWAQLCTLWPRTWDQVHLQHAWSRQPEMSRPVFLPLPHGYGAGGGYIGHDSFFHRHWKNRTPRRVLLVASGPDAPAWCADHLDGYIREGFWVAAMNNGWSLVEDRMNWWIHSSDFDAHRGRPEGDHFTENPDWQVTKPFWQKHRILLPDLLCHLLNCGERDGRKLEVHLVGTNFVYQEGGVTHFYGKGGLDPLRFGGEVLDEALASVARFYEEHGSRIVNASPMEGSRLPFDPVDAGSVSHRLTAPEGDRR